MVVYCGPTCQKSAWPAHKIMCRMFVKKKKETKETKKLFDELRHLFAKEGLSNTPCQKKMEQIMAQMLEEQQKNEHSSPPLHTPTAHHWNTLLYIFCYYGRLLPVNHLLMKKKERAIDVNALCLFNDDGTTKFAPLHAACQNGNEELILRLLREHDIDINRSNNLGVTPLRILCTKKTESNSTKNMVEVFLQTKNIDIHSQSNDGTTSLFDAAQNGNTAIVHLLLQTEGIENSLNQPKTDTGVTPLIIACQNGHSNVVSLFLKVKGIEVNHQRKTGATSLFFACKNGHTAVVNLLLQVHDLDYNLPAKDNMTPLWMACLHKHVDIVRLLLQQPNIDLNRKQYQHGSAFEYAKLQQNNQTIISLLASAGAK